MPKRKQNTRKLNRGITREPSGEVLYKGRVLLNPTLALGANVLPLTPQIVNPGLLSSMSDVFQEYRFENVQIKSYPKGNHNDTDDETYAVAYGNETTDVPATGLDGLMQYPKSQMLTSSTTNPQMLNVNRQMLLGQNPLKWWRTRPSSTTPPSSDTWDQLQGYINVVANVIGTAYMVVKYVIRFANAMGASQTPEPYRRPSLVSKFHPELAVTDMYLPDHPFPFPHGLNVDEAFLRSSRNFNFRSKVESVRLKQLCMGHASPARKEVLPGDSGSCQNHESNMSEGVASQTAEEKRLLLRRFCKHLKVDPDAFLPFLSSEGTFPSFPVSNN